MNLETSISREPGTYSDYSFIDQGTAPSRRKPILAILAALAIIAVLALAWFAMRGPKAPVAPGKAGTAAEGKPAAGNGTDIPSVTIIVPGTTLVSNTITATGSLAARHDLPVGAVGEGGLVTRVLVESGRWVNAGQILAVVDRQVQAQQSNQIAAQIRVAEADARLAQSELNRARALADRGFVSKADIERKTAQRDAAQARVAVARAQLGENSARIRRLDIRAPASGLVLERRVEVGQVVGPGSGTLFRIAQGGGFEMQARVSEGDLARMHTGMTAQVTPVGTDQGFTGQIWQISPVIDPQSRQGMVKIALAFDRGLRPGGFASARIASGTVQAPLLPESAVQSDSKGNYVLVAGRDNKVERRDVVIGGMTEHGVSILSGLTGQEQVIQSAGGFLNPGEVIRPRRAIAAK